MYEDTTGGQHTTTHHSPPLLSAHNPNALLSAQQAAAAAQQQQQVQQQSAIQPPHTPHQSSQTNGTHSNGTVASLQPQQTPSAASDSPVSPPTGNKSLPLYVCISFLMRIFT